MFRIPLKKCTFLSFIHTYRKWSGLMGFYWASPGSNQTFFFLHSSRIKQRNGRRALLAMRDFYLFLFSVLASRLAGFCRIMDIPFLCLFSLEIFTHTKETKWNASPLSQPTFFAPVVPHGLSLLERVGFFFTPIPQRACGNQNHQCCISQAFYWL